VKLLVLVKKILQECTKSGKIDLHILMLQDLEDLHCSTFIREKLKKILEDNRSASATDIKRIWEETCPFPLSLRFIQKFRRRLGYYLCRFLHHNKTYCFFKRYLPFFVLDSLNTTK
jgi:hypothetical protein